MDKLARVRDLYFFQECGDTFPRKFDLIVEWQENLQWYAVNLLCRVSFDFTQCQSYLLMDWNPHQLNRLQARYVVNLPCHSRIWWHVTLQIALCILKGSSENWVTSDRASTTMTPKYYYAYRKTMTQADLPGITVICRSRTATCA